MDHLAANAVELVDGLNHVHRDTDSACLVCNGASDGLTDPPRGVRGELVTTTVLELVDCFHQADVAFLDQIQELQTAIGIFFRDGNHQSQVGLDHLFLGAA